MRAIPHSQQGDSTDRKSNLFHVNKEWWVCHVSGNTEKNNPHGTANKSHAWLQSIQRRCPKSSLSGSYLPRIKMAAWPAKPANTFLWSYCCVGLHKVPQKCLPARDGSLLCDPINSWLMSLKRYRFCVWTPFLLSFFPLLPSPHPRLDGHEFA